MISRFAFVLTATALFAGASLSADPKPVANADKDCPDCCCGEVLKLGAVASSSKSVEVFRALRHYFAKNKMPMEFVLYSNYDLLNEALLKKQVDISWNSPLAHAKFHIKAGDSQVVVMRDVDVNYRVSLIVRKDAEISRLSDLATKTMIFGSCDSADCTVLPVHFLKKEGVDFDKVKLLSLHKEVDEKGVPCHSAQHVWQALVKNRGQAGIIGQGMWKKIQEQKPDEAALFKEVWTSPPFSHCVFTARKDFDKDTAEKFSKIMVGMDGKDPLTAEILKLEHCKKWVSGGKEAQDGFADLIKAVRDSQLPETLRK